MSYWIKCSDRLPKNFEFVLVSDGRYIEYSEYSFREGFFIDSMECRRIGLKEKDIKLWFRIPTLPKEVEDE